MSFFFYLVRTISKWNQIRLKVFFDNFSLFGSWTTFEPDLTCFIDDLNWTKKKDSPVVTQLQTRCNRTCNEKDMWPTLFFYCETNGPLFRVQFDIVCRRLQTRQIKDLSRITNDSEFVAIEFKVGTNLKIIVKLIKKKIKNYNYFRNNN